MRIEALSSPRIEPTLLERLVEERAVRCQHVGSGGGTCISTWVKLAIDYGRQWLSLQLRIQCKQYLAVRTDLWHIGRCDSASSPVRHDTTHSISTTSRYPWGLSTRTHSASISS
jgi:hypothetical protein